MRVNCKILQKYFILGSSVYTSAYDGSVDIRLVTTTPSREMVGCYSAGRGGWSRSIPDGGHNTPLVGARTHR